MRSFELKRAWADRQAQVLESEIRTWHSAGGYGVSFDKHPERPGHIIRLKVGDIPPGLPLVLGDTLYALRSCLDHLAHDLASSHTSPLPESASESSEFPIFGDRPMTSTERTRKIGAMHPGAMTVIENLQPHLREDAYRDDALWKLHELARIDRHRFIHVAVAQLGGIGLGGDNLHVELMELHGGDPPPTEDGAELGYAQIRPTDPGRPMYMNFTPEPQVILKDGPLAGEAVLDLLQLIRERIDLDVVPPLRRFLRPV